MKVFRFSTKKTLDFNKKNLDFKKKFLFSRVSNIEQLRYPEISFDVL